MSEVGAVPLPDVPGLTSTGSSGRRFSVAPELATATYTKLGELQDVVGEMVREADVLGRSVPLGSGYAGEVGAFMARYGFGDDGSAVAQLTSFGREIEDLKERIASALKKYQRADDAAADGVDCAGG
ncbi:hypothetical protein VSH64_20225 [Amycolatopsis rhabdoformis]|uniref:ESX-1 secretion-associated protein n=1 Tax=Amycolatopsis rhabdoformis TaxID=1448059 RepID=A0ABZ1IJG3_9PSEU|nr:hypothetical protein [Amycolatopsis rhabdoformis]WSE34387.1 hypothetical protein VSH64_20225 [Amycolatopsis rhabdoformis]